MHTNERQFSDQGLRSDPKKTESLQTGEDLKEQLSFKDALLHPQQY